MNFISQSVRKEPCMAEKVFVAEHLRHVAIRARWKLRP
jgi:hypothetical protein